MPSSWSWLPKVSRSQTVVRYPPEIGFVTIRLAGLRAMSGRHNRIRSKSAAELDTHSPSILDKSFKGEL